MTEKATYDVPQQAHEGATAGSAQPRSPTVVYIYNPGSTTPKSDRHSAVLNAYEAKTLVSECLGITDPDNAQAVAHLTSEVAAFKERKAGADKFDPKILIVSNGAYPIAGLSLI